MKKFTKDQIARIEIAFDRFGFTCYEGPAGPSDIHANKNTRALYRYLKSKKVKAVLVPLSQVEPDCWCDEDNDTEPLLVVKVGNRYLGFDRWGFSGGYVKRRGNDFIDQASPAGAVAFLTTRITIPQFYAA